MMLMITKIMIIKTINSSSSISNLHPTLQKFKVGFHPILPNPGCESAGHKKGKMSMMLFCRTYQLTVPREWNKRKGSSLSLRFQSFLPPVIIVTDSQTDTGGRPFIYGNYCFGLVTQVNQVLNGSSTGPYGSSMSPY